jgi:protein-S-isoprenylcysteine O-methyltransferase Ste14
MSDKKRMILAILGSATFFVIAPLTVAGLIPWWITRWRSVSSPGRFMLLRGVGVLLIVAGIPILLYSFARFAIEGLGTPAPVFPTRQLVVRGLYRFVRNPMYVALLLVVAGQALFFLSLRLLEYALTIWFVSHMFVVTYEEPALRSKYGEEYERFRAHVPRWIPRVRPWQDSARS